MNSGAAELELDADIPHTHEHPAWTTLKRLFRHRLFLSGLGLFGIILLAAALAPWIAPVDPTKLAMRFKFNLQIPRRTPPTISQVTKRGIADLALHNLFTISHRELEHHQGCIVANSLPSRQRHKRGSLSMVR